MNRCVGIVCFMLAWTGVVSGDRVVMMDGQVLKGRILSETEYEVELQTARNSSGTVRTIQVIDREAVKSMSRGDEAMAVTDSAPVSESVPDGTADEDALDITSAHNWLETSTGLLQAGKYDEAAERFGRVANHPRLVEQSREASPAKSRPALELRARAYRLWMTAVEGKQEYLETRADEAEDAADGRLDRAEDRLKEYQKKERAEDDNRKIIELRSRQRTNPGAGELDHQEALEKARINMAQYEAWDRKNALKIQNLDAEHDLLREQLKQIERELKALGKRSK